MATRSSRLATAAIGAVLLFLPEPASAQLAPSGAVRPPRVRRVPADYRSLQAAIDASNRGDVVLVEQGNHAGPIDFRGKAIEVVSRDGAAATTITGDGTDSVVRFHSGEGP